MIIGEDIFHGEHQRVPSEHTDMSPVVGPTHELRQNAGGCHSVIRMGLGVEEIARRELRGKTARVCVAKRDSRITRHAGRPGDGFVGSYSHAGYYDGLN